MGTTSDEQLALMLQQEEIERFQHLASVFDYQSEQIGDNLDKNGKKNSPKYEEDRKTIEERRKAAEKALANGLVPRTATSEDDTPGVLDVHALFVTFNDLYFEGKLAAVSVEWSNRMTLCAGLCSWQRGDCRIKLSSKLLQYRTNKEIKETLLHECIHAYLFVTRNNKDRDGHGQEFIKLMNWINQAGKFNISIYHNFKDEVDYFRVHWWQCDKCKKILKRAMNRPPSMIDWWFPDHQLKCGGNYIKIKEPEEKKNEKKRKREEMTTKSAPNSATKQKPYLVIYDSDENQFEQNKKGSDDIEENDEFHELIPARKKIQTTINFGTAGSVPKTTGDRSVDPPINNTSSSDSKSSSDAMADIQVKSTSTIPSTHPSNSVLPNLWKDLHSNRHSSEAASFVKNDIPTSSYVPGINAQAAKPSVIVLDDDWLHFDSDET